jgi:hypothetical protein
MEGLKSGKPLSMGVKTPKDCNLFAIVGGAVVESAMVAGAAAEQSEQ